MEVSTHQNHSIPSFQCYPHCEDESDTVFNSVCMKDYDFHTDFMNCGELHFCLPLYMESFKKFLLLWKSIVTIDIPVCVTRTGMNSKSNNE